MTRCQARSFGLPVIRAAAHSHSPANEDGNLVAEGSPFTSIDSNRFNRESHVGDIKIPSLNPHQYPPRIETLIPASSLDTKMPWPTLLAPSKGRIARPETGPIDRVAFQFQGL